MNKRNKTKRRIAKENPFNIVAFGNCPVQAWGNLDSGEYYYFRSRGCRWSLDVCKSESDWWSWKDDRFLFQYSENYGSEYEAGWITSRQAVRFATKAIKLYLQSK